MAKVEITEADTGKIVRRASEIEEIREPPQRLEEIPGSPRYRAPREDLPEPHRAELERRRDIKIQERTQKLKAAFGKAGAILKKGATAASETAHKMGAPPPKKAVRQAYVVRQGKGTKRKHRRELVLIEQPQEPYQPTIMDKLIGGQSPPGQETHLDRLFGTGRTEEEHPTDTYMRKIMGTGKKGKGGTGGLPYKL